MYYQTVFKHKHWFINLFLVAVIVAFAYFVIFIFLPKILPEAEVANTEKQGIIFRNEKWSGQIVITGDIWAFPGSRVTIEPSTKILVSDKDHFNLHFLPWDLRSGLNTGKDSFGVKNGELFRDEKNKIQMDFAKIYAIGTAKQPIEITSPGPNPPSPYDFNGLSISDGILGFVKISNYRKLSVGDNVTIRDSTLMNSGECAVCIEYSSPTIAGNVFQDNLRNYIWVLGGNPKISDNLFLSSKGDGIVVDPKTIGAPIIYHNSFEMPNQIAIRLLSGSEENGGAIVSNDFAGSNKIVMPCDSKMNLVHNQIRGMIEFSQSGNCYGNFIMGPNYWFSRDRNSILKEKILGKGSGFNITIPTVLSTPPQNVGVRK